MNRGEVPEEFAAMKTSSSEVLHDHSVADDIHMVEVEDMFGNNRKGKRNPLVICGMFFFISCLNLFGSLSCSCDLGHPCLCVIL